VLLLQFPAAMGQELCYALVENESVMIGMSGSG
jgi:hypothetical protein